MTSAAGEVLPVPGAEVRVEETDGPRRAFDGITDAEGIARFPGVSAVPLAVRARKDLVAGRGSALGHGEGFRVDAVITLSQTATVTGVVRQPSDGAGLGGVNVLLDGGPWKGILGAGTTDAEGRFLIEGIPGGDGTVYRIRAEDPRTLRGGSSPVFVLAAGEAKEVDVTLRGIGSVTGVLRTFDGTRTLAGAEIDVSSHDEDGNESPALRVSTGEDGRYRADGVPEGTIVVRARVPLSGLAARATGRLVRRGRDADARPLGLSDGARARSRPGCLRQSPPRRRPRTRGPARSGGDPRDAFWRRSTTSPRSMRRSRCSSGPRSGSSRSTAAFCAGEPWPARPSSRTSAMPRSERCAFGSSSPTRTTTASSSPPPESSSSPAASPTSTGSRAVHRSGPTPRGTPLSRTWGAGRPDASSRRRRRRERVGRRRSPPSPPTARRAT